jgi:electron transfer flavoprotein alpha subunit
MKRILVVQDTEHIENSINLLQFCEHMYGTIGYEAFLLSFEDSLVRVFGFFHSIYTVPEKSVDLHDIRRMCDIVEDLHSWNCFDSILVPATRLGRILAPRLAKRLHTGLVADVIDINTHGEQLEMIRTAYSGSIHAGIVATGNTPIMMSVHPGTCTYAGKACLDSVVIPYTEPPKKLRNVMRCLDVVTREQSYDIRTSEILVSGGGGVKKQQLPLLQRLADSLGGDVSASRKLVDQGLAPRNIQVGQSGKIVRARLYVALGIDGAIQHVEGLRNVETIIAVNTNVHAPICSLSDIVVQGDAGEFIEKLLKKINTTLHSVAVFA